MILLHGHQELHGIQPRNADDREFQGK
jgi:hypothetical protein